MSERAPRADNPFLEGQQYRTDELGDAVVTSAHWRWTTWLCIAGLIVSNSLWGIREIVRVPVKVFMAEIDLSGTTRLIGALPSHYTQKEEVIKGHLRDFVRLLRRVIDDKVAMGEDWDEKKGIYGRVTKNGKQLLSAHLATQGNPLEKREPVMVDILRTLSKGAQTFDITWMEQRYSAEPESRQLIETSYWSGIFSFKEAPPKNEQEVLVNYLGIWWDQWAFSENK